MLTLSCSLRYYYGLLRQESLLDALGASLDAVHTHGFTPVALEPHPKDGGVFLRFQYTAPAPDPALLAQIERAVRDHLRASGGVPSSAGLRRGDAWLVRGTPWPEVRPPSSALSPPALTPDLGHAPLRLPHPPRRL